MRKPVLEWSEPVGRDSQCYAQVSTFRATIYCYHGKWCGFLSGCDFSFRDIETADAAKLACEDHLATLLEPLAATYEKLKGNRNATR